jgi:hypothetical protein
MLALILSIIALIISLVNLIRTCNSYIKKDGKQ